MADKNFNQICGIDEFGRIVPACGNKKTDKEVGIFYFLWIGEHDDRIYDVNDLLMKNPKALWNPEGTEESPGWGFHFWGKPLYGYYKSDDLFVIRKHVEMLTMAGVDYIICDTTNAQVYAHVLLALMQTLDEYYKAGWNVPKIACYTNSNSVTTMQIIYDNFYKNKNRYPDIWYKPNGKPVIIGRDPEKQMDKELYDFFDVRVAQWPNEAYMEEGFPWMEWTYPQPVHNGVISVSVAQHSKGTFVMQEGNWGRGYDHDGNDNHENFRLGQNFQKQWDNALKFDAQNVFITGWNEWGAQKINLGGETVFCDCFSEEYSRDVEPMEGGYNDAFYMQMIQNIRKFKDTGKYKDKSFSKSIDINAGVTQWDNVTNIYYAFDNKNIARKHPAVDQRITYKTKPAKNNIQSVKVTHDKHNLYFLITTEKDIKDGDCSPNWMNLFISAGNVKKQGWEGYSYVVNRRCAGSFDKLNQSGNTTTYNMTDINITKNYMQIVVPRDVIGAGEECKSVYFKVSDSVENVRNINDYYVTGKVLPLGRLSYQYNF